MSKVVTDVKSNVQFQKTPNNKLHSIPVPKEVMAQIGVDICNLPEVDGFKHIVVAIDYFSKWSEAKPLKDKTELCQLLSYIII